LRAEPQAEREHQFIDSHIQNIFKAAEAWCGIANLAILPREYASASGFAEHGWLEDESDLLIGQFRPVMSH
jgi:hypothetical protein